jgi:hypothetical protein
MLELSVWSAQVGPGATPSSRRRVRTPGSDDRRAHRPSKQAAASLRRVAQSPCGYHHRALCRGPDGPVWQQCGCVPVIRPWHRLGAVGAGKQREHPGQVWQEPRVGGDLPGPATPGSLTRPGESAVLAPWCNVVALAADADDEPLVPEGRERVGGGAVGDPMLLGKAQDRGHAAGQLAGTDLLAQETGELLV